MKSNSEFVIIYKTVSSAKDSAKSFTYMSLFNAHGNSKSQTVTPCYRGGNRGLAQSLTVGPPSILPLRKDEQREGVAGGLVMWPGSAHFLMFM